MPGEPEPDAADVCPGFRFNAPRPHHSINRPSSSTSASAARQHQPRFSRSAKFEPVWALIAIRRGEDRPKAETKVGRPGASVQRWLRATGSPGSLKTLTVLGPCRPLMILDHGRRHLQRGGKYSRQIFMCGGPAVGIKVVHGFPAAPPPTKRLGSLIAGVAFHSDAAFFLGGWRRCIPWAPLIKASRDSGFRPGGGDDIDHGSVLPAVLPD